MDTFNPYEPDRDPIDPEWETDDSGDGFDEPSADATDDTGDAQMLCPHCLAPNLPLADFCHKCCGPISSLATMDPYKNIFAQGWAYGRAVSNPTKPIILWGMLLIFGPTVLALSCSLIDFIPLHRSPSVFHYDMNLGLLWGIGVLVLYAAICWRVIRRYRYLRQHPPGHCTKCNYDLRHLTEPRCPECGQTFQPDDEHDLENDDLEDADLPGNEPA